MALYKIINDEAGEEFGVKVNSSGHECLPEGACIPFANGNRDYEDYLAWVDEGNTADPAD